MFKFPDPKTKDPKGHRIQRRLEVIPAILTWLTLIGMPLLSFLFPVFVAIFIIVFDVYWIFRTVFISTYLKVAYQKLGDGKNTDWWGRCQNIHDPEEYLNILDKDINNYRESLLEMRGKEKRLVKKKLKKTIDYRKEVEQLVKIKDQIMDWRKVVHVVLLPTAGEGPEAIEPAIESIKNSNFPNSQIIVLLATEEREDKEHREAKVKYLTEKFDGVFKEFLVTTHEVRGDEMKCKASNAKYAAKKLMVYLDEHKIDYKRVIFSNFDCESVCHPEYLAALTYAYVTDPKRLQRAYQPLPMYHNNIWDTNAVVRVIVTSSSFWHMFQSTRKTMVTFSSHSEPFDTLVKLDFWPVNMISEDSIIYWKGFSYFHGDYKVKPIHLPISMDAVLAETYSKTLVNQYKQKRRWAYGIENFPVSMRAIWPDKKIPLSKKLKVTFEMLEGHHSWATAPFMLAFLGWLPLILGGPEFNESVLAHNLPIITRFLMTLALAGLVSTMFMSFMMLPPLPKKYPKRRYFNMFFQWFLVPFIAPFFAIPAIESQTRILLKKYFGSFWVTPKVVKEDNSG